MTFGPPPKVIWLRGCDYPTGVAEGLMLQNAKVRNVTTNRRTPLSNPA
jgi:predicted nuclease of predicted toxin-antitoxin system